MNLRTLCFGLAAVAFVAATSAVACAGNLAPDKLYVHLSADVSAGVDHQAAPLPLDAPVIVAIDESHRFDGPPIAACTIHPVVAVYDFSGMDLRSTIGTDAPRGRDVDKRVLRA